MFINFINIFIFLLLFSDLRFGSVFDKGNGFVLACVWLLLAYQSRWFENMGFQLVYKKKAFIRPRILQNVSHVRVVTRAKINSLLS